jgi:hypothetical protein
LFTIVVILADLGRKLGVIYRTMKVMAGVRETTYELRVRFGKQRMSYESDSGTGDCFFPSML